MVRHRHSAERCAQSDIPSDEQQRNVVGANLEYHAEAEDCDGADERQATAKEIADWRGAKGSHDGAGAEHGDDDGDLLGGEGDHVILVAVAGRELVEE